MAYTYDTVTIDSTDFTVFGDLDAIDAYATAAYHGAAWRALSDVDTKGMIAVTATRLIDRQRWIGTKTDSDQAHSFPRSATGIEGDEDDEIPTAVLNGYFELCLALADGAEVQTEQNTAQKIQSLGAGSARIAFFREAEGPAHRFPLIIHELFRDYLKGARFSYFAFSSGTDGVSVTAQDFGFSDGI